MNKKGSNSKSKKQKASDNKKRLSKASKYKLPKSNMKLAKKAIQKSKSEETLTNSYSKHELLSHDQIVANSIARIKRLEDIHKMQSYIHRDSDVFAFWSFLFVVLLGNFFSSLLILFLIIFLKSTFLLFVIFVLGISLGFIYEKYLNGMHHLFLHHHLFSKIFLILTAILSIFYIVSLNAYISVTFGLRFDSSYVILATATYFVAYIIPYAYVKIVRH